MGAARGGSLCVRLGKGEGGYREMGALGAGRFAASR